MSNTQTSHIAEVHSSTPPPVYGVLEDHQRTDETWELQRLLDWLQTWKHRFVSEFKLEISETSLCVDFLHWRRYGHFRRAHNGFGLLGEIAINRMYLHDRPPWELLGTLLHELLHAWQHSHGKPGKGNYHNRQFRKKAESYGLLIDEVGHTQYEGNSAFTRLLDRYDVQLPHLAPPPLTTRPKTKLRKWACSCDPPINVRVAVEHFHAKCLTCNRLFVCEVSSGHSPNIPARPHVPTRKTAEEKKLTGNHELGAPNIRSSATQTSRTNEFSPE